MNVFLKYLFAIPYRAYSQELEQSGTPGPLPSRFRDSVPIPVNAVDRSYSHSQSGSSSLSSLFLFSSFGLPGAQLVAPLTMS